MTIEEHEGELLVQFSGIDFQNDGAQSIISSIKADIRRVTRKNPDGFAYDPKTGVWTMKATKRNKDLLQDLQKFYLIEMKHMRC